MHEMVTTLVVSPHLDDAVLSIAGSIAAWAAAGERVVIATLYTHGTSSVPALAAFADFEARREEDRAACELLGAEPRWLGLVETAFRTPAAPVFHGSGRDDHAARALADLADQLAAARVLVPLGVGNHVDHAAAAFAAVAAGLADRLAFYEDVYALHGGLRRRHPVTRLRPRADVLAASPRLAGVMGRIASKVIGRAATDLFAPGASWSASVSPVGVQRAAIACYRTQVRAFGGLLGVIRALEADRAASGGELLWRMV